MTAFFSSKDVSERPWHDIFKMLREENILIWNSKIFRNDEKGFFSDGEEMREFIANIPLL